MTSFIKVLWIDDEHEKLNAVKAEAKLNGIDLVGFKSLNSGLKELEDHFPIYDGVLFDAKFFEDDNNIPGTEDTEYLHRAKERLLKIPKPYSIFVLTGQAEAYGDNTFKKAFKQVYRKGQDLEGLFGAIKNAANQLPDTKLKEEHKLAFACCTKAYIGAEEPAGWLLQLLKIEDEKEAEHYFNTIRKIVEQLFLGFHQHQLLPDAFVTKGGVALNPSSKFLEGKNTAGNYHIENNYRHLDSTHLPTQIAHYLRTLLAITNRESHIGSTKPTRTPYLFKSLLYQLLDTLAWFKGYIDSNPEKTNWGNLKDWKSGVVYNVLPSGIGYFAPDKGGDNIEIPHALVAENKLTKGQKAQVLTGIGKGKNNQNLIIITELKILK
ncbi:MAG: hypothetical protein LAT81_12325 [Oceanicaulis sp.]|nr:hypothetical protein [Oceanicaulis sp.]